MADCFSLLNAAELVAKMRDYADTAEDNIYGICVNTPNVLRQAADAIEQLVQENAKLKAERDAAITDLSLIVHDMDNTCICNYCIGCEKDGHYASCNTDYGDMWKWRGVPKEEEDD